MTADHRAALLEAATRVRTNARAPYSGFFVGAAVLDESGRIHTGCNIEIASFSQTCCAERVAVFNAISHGAERLVACAVVTELSPPASPCGACRQVLHEFGGDAMTVFLADLGSEVVECTLAELLPRAFQPEDLLSRMHSGSDG